MTPAQVLWINMVTSCTLGVALAFEPAEQGIMQRKPRAPKDALLSGLFVWRVVMVSVLMMFAALGLFLWEQAQGTELAVARTMAVSTIVAAEMFYLLSSRFAQDSAFGLQALRGNAVLLWTLLACAVMQMGFVHWSPLQAVFASADLSAGQWAKVVLAGAAVFALVELDKWRLRSARPSIRPD